jgi:hypothetical protein
MGDLQFSHHLKQSKEEKKGLTSFKIETFVKKSITLTSFDFARSSIKLSPFIKSVAFNL